MAAAELHPIRKLPTVEECLARAPDMLSEFRQTIALTRAVIEQSRAAMARADELLAGR